MIITRRFLRGKMTGVAGEIIKRDKTSNVHQDDGAKFLTKGAELLINEWSSMRNGQCNVYDFLQPNELLKIIKPEINNQPLDDSSVIDLCKTVARYSLKSNHPDQHNALWQGVDQYALLGSWLTETFNTQAYTYEVAPVFSLIESFLIKHIAVDLAGYSPDEYDGTMQAGGSIGNMYGLNLARYRLEPSVKTTGLRGQTEAGRLVAFTSEDSHYSMQKGFAFLGLGTDNLISIPTNAAGEMIPSKLEDAIAEQIKKGAKPFFVNCTSGSTVIGAFDPLEEIADICERFGIWLHVDAAWGGGVLFSEKHRRLLKGIERADSFITNPHKLLCAPTQCSFFLTKHRGLLSKAHSAQASYLFMPDKFYDTSYDTGDKVIQCGRKVDAFKFYLKYVARGKSGIQNAVDNAFEKTDYLRNLIKELDYFVPVVDADSSTHCNNVCFWYLPLSLREPGVNYREKILNDDQFRQRVAKVGPLLKEKMMTEGTLMVAYQPHRSLPNFFRMVVTTDPPATNDTMKFVVNEIDRLGSNLKV